MKKILPLCALLAAVLTVPLVSCDEEKLKELIAVLSISLNQTQATLPVGATLTLTPLVQPETATNQSVAWASSDSTVAAVDAGTVTALKVGTANVMAITADGGKIATCALTVTQPVESVRLSKAAVAISVGDTLTLTATVLPADAFNKAVAWTSSNTAVASVSPANGGGKVTAHAEGEAKIIVSTEEGSKHDTCTVTVSKAVIAVTGVTLNKTTATLTVGETLSITPTVLPADATNKAVAWTSGNTAVATVNNGTVNALGKGTAIITVTTQDGSKTAACAVTVNPVHVPVVSVTLNKTAATLTTDETLTLTPTVLPADATNKAVAWNSNNTAVARVSSNGAVTALGTGSAVITATTQDGSKTAACTVTVKGIPVAAVLLNRNTASLPIGSELRLTPTVLPASATDKAVTWSSSNEAVAVVYGGVVTGIAAGTVTITVTTQDGAKTASCTLFVGTPISSIALDKSSATVSMGSTLTLMPIILPANATHKNIVWTSGNEAVVTVSNGVVTPVANGTTAITATTEEGGRTASCAVTVTTPVSEVTLNEATASLLAGKTLTLTATVQPATASNKTIIWSSNNTAVATVSGGMITAKANGSATITATTQDGGKIATCAITVSTAVTGVTLNLTTATLFQDNTLTLTATVQPATASNKTVTWTSSNTAAAIVNNGVVTPVGDGTAVITATTEEGEKTASCTVVVGLGTISFATEQTWTIGSQEWSDAVTAANCNKTTFNGYNVDCRSNPLYKGDLFSWYAVDTYKNKLCPDGWRVPTRDDFIDLDKALGGNGTGDNSQFNTTLRNKYLNVWGGQYGGYAYSGSLSYQGLGAYYWSQSELSSTRGYSLYFYSDVYVTPQDFTLKNYGFTLRCVK